MPRKISRKLCRSRQRNLQLNFRVETGARPNVRWNGGGEGHEQVGGGNRREYGKVIGRLGLTWGGSTPVAPLHESTQRLFSGLFGGGISLGRQDASLAVVTRLVLMRGCRRFVDEVVAQSLPPRPKDLEMSRF